VCRNELDGLDGGASTHRHLWVWQNDMKKIQNASTSAGYTIAKGDVSLLSVGISTCSHAQSYTGRWDVVAILSRQSIRRNLKISISDVTGGEEGKKTSKKQARCWVVDVSRGLSVDETMDCFWDEVVPNTWPVYLCYRASHRFRKARRFSCFILVGKTNQ
jgi:hypothetical protein